MGGRVVTLFVLGLACLGLLTAPAGPAGGKPAGKKGAKNLVPNGDFEKGTDSPEGWQQVDGLTTFWVKVRHLGWIDARLDLMILAGAFLLVLAGPGRAALDNQRRFS